jgi:hypothetical protein
VSWFFVSFSSIRDYSAAWDGRRPSHEFVVLAAMAGEGRGRPMQLSRYRR